MAALLISQSVFVFITRVSGAPLPNIDSELTDSLTNKTALKTNVAPPWVSNPSTRGTSDILWSCLATLTLCVYTAIHLNVPPPAEGHWAFYLRKTRWVAMAVFAPEIVLYTAFRQWYEARTLIKKLNELQQYANLEDPEFVKVRDGSFCKGLAFHFSISKY
jgi:hypothetical protein